MQGADRQSVMDFRLDEQKRLKDSGPLKEYASAISDPAIVRQHKFVVCHVRLIQQISH